jgi:hypothetical protein
MKRAKQTKHSVVNALIIGMLVLVSLVAMTNVFVMNSTMMTGAPLGLAPAGEDVAPVSGSRGLNGDGDDYVDLYRFGGDPQILIDGFSPGVDDILIGEPDIYLDIPVESLKSEDADDNNGDDILYNVTVNVDETATTYYDTDTHSWEDASSYITWDTSSISPTFKENWANEGNALLIDGVGSKYIPWFYNDYNAPGFLDDDNDQRADNDEFYQVRDDYKMYDGFVFDVSGDAPAGVYNITVEIEYRYQTFQNVSTQRLSGGFNNYYDPDTSGPWGTGDLGLFEYYFWEPYEMTGGTVDFNVPANIGFRKRFNYYENNVAPAGASWEAIPDMGYNNDNPNWYNTQGGGWDTHSNYDRDGTISWTDGGAATLGTVTNNWNTAGYNDYSPSFQSYLNRICDQYPYDVYDGNGTWEYSGYEGDTVWSSVKTEVEYIEIVVENGWYMSQPWGDRCQLVPDPSSPYYLKAGDEFKKMYVTINNRDTGNQMTDVYVNISFDDAQYFSLKHDWAWKDVINAGGSSNFYYRMYALNDTPVNRYNGEVTITFTREGIRVTEVLPLEYILYYTPNLQNYYDFSSPYIQVSETINKGHPESTVDFSIINSGNTLLENGILTMDYSDFKSSGEEYTDPEGGEGTFSPQIEVPLLDYGSLTNPHDLALNVEIPNHWQLSPGVYKLFMDYEGYYFNDGVLGEPTNYVKVWMNWYDDDWDPSTDMNSYCVIDTDGDENMDIFGADETRAIDGIFMYVEVEEFDPYEPQLHITDISINDGTDTFEQGSVTNGKLELTLRNDGQADLTDLEVELDLSGYFVGKTYYDGYHQQVENPVDSIAAINMNESAVATLELEGVDKLLPPGTHRLTLKYTYCYDNGSTPSEISKEMDELYFNITVTDALPDIIPTVSSMTGNIRLGHKVVDINLYVNLANQEYYSLSDIDATLIVGGNTPFEVDSDSSATNISCKWLNPANNKITAGGQNTNNMYFNLNLDPSATEGTYYLDLDLHMFNDNTMTYVDVPTKLEVKIYPKIAKLRIVDVTVSTGKITPGKEFTLELTIQNDGGEAAREIYIEFLEAYVGQGGMIENYEEINPTGARYPFSSSVVKAYVEEIQPEGTGTATYTVVGDLNIYPGITYFQNIGFDYKDSTGNTHQTTDVAPIKTDNTYTAKVGGENYIWDTDREAWINEKEAAAEEIMDYAPFWIIAVIIIWLVTLLIVFLFIIRPKYRKEKMDLPDDESGKHRKLGKKGEPETGEPEIVDYSGTEESPYGPAPGPGTEGEVEPTDESPAAAPVASTTPTDESTPPLAASTDKALPPASEEIVEEEPDAFEELPELDPEPESETKDLPIAKPANKDDLPRKGPKKDE